MADERTVEERDDSHLIHTQSRDADLNNLSSQHASTDQNILTAQPRRQRPVDQSQKQRFFNRLSSKVAILIALALILAAALGWFFKSNYSVYEVQGSSMEPTLSGGEAVLLKHTTKLQHGEIVVFKKPKQWEHTTGDGELLIKRVVAVPGDVLEFKNSAFYVNGHKTLPLIAKYICPNGKNSYKHKLSSNEFFAAGDNAAVSVDSRREFCTLSPHVAYINPKAVANAGKIIAHF